MKKALLLRLSALGDVVLTTAAVEMLHRQGFAVYLATREPFAQLFACDERITSIITLQRHPSLKDVLGVVRRIRGEKFDLVLDLHRKPLTVALKLFSGGKIKLSYDKRVLERRMAVWFHKKIRYVPVAELYQRPIRKALGLPDGVFHRPRLMPCPDVSLPIELPERYIVLAPGAGYPTRAWPHYPRLATLIRSGLNMPVVVVGTKGEWRDGSDVEAMPPLIDLAGKTDIQQLMQVVFRADAVVCNDSGVMHIADALDVPVIAIYGPTIPEFGFKPLGDRSRVVQIELPCRPCSLHGKKNCKFGDRRCLRDIPAEQVFRTLSDILNVSGK